MPSKPAATQRSMPSVPCAWALARSPRRWASWVIACSSARPYWAARGLVPRVPPPVAITLMKSAPALCMRRTARRTPSSPSASFSRNQQWPPVDVIGAPPVTIRGPTSRPSRTARATGRITSVRPPQSRRVVMPRLSAARRLFTVWTVRVAIGWPIAAYSGLSPSRSGSPLHIRCTWLSISPGAITCSGKSSRHVAPSASLSASSPTAVIAPSSTSRAASVRGSAAALQTRRRPRISVLFIGYRLNLNA